MVRPGRLFEGPAGSCTEIIIEGEPSVPDKAATVAAWFCVCPGQSPAWDRYILGIIHLRDIPGVPPADVRVPGATHEIMLYACDPDRGPRPDDMETWSALRPINFVEQLELPSDADAAELLALAAHAVANGMLWAEPPLSGQTEPWRTALLKSAAHARGEAHAP